MDGLRRQEKISLENAAEEEYNLNEGDAQNGEQVVEQPKKERKSFLDKLTERVKDFLDNAE